jgi:hypothetical protein
MVVVGLEADVRRDRGRDLEDAEADHALLVLLGLVLVRHRRDAQALLDAGRAARVHLQQDGLPARQAVEHLDVLQQILPGERLATIAREAALELRTLDRDDVRNHETVRHGRLDDLQVADRLVEPPEGPPQPAVNFGERLLDRALRGLALRPHGGGLCAQGIEKAAGLGCVRHRQRWGKGEGHRMQGPCRATFRGDGPQRGDARRRGVTRSAAPGQAQ